MNRPVWAPFFFAVLTVVFLVPAPFRTAFSQPGEMHRIFILHSYEKNHVCGQPQHNGVIAALTTAGFEENADFKVRAYYMDTKRTNNTPALIQRQARKALAAIHRFKPHILVPLDDNAFRTVALELTDSPMAIVFCGLNGQPEAYNRIKPFMETRRQPGHNITGVYEKLYIADAIRVHARLLPGLEKVRIFVDTSPTGDAIHKQILLEMENASIPCDWEITTITDWEQYQQAILQANRDPATGAIYPAVLLLKDPATGATYTAPEIFAWTVRHSKKPEIPLNYSFAHMGLFGGAAVDFHAMGVQVGQMVARILNGAPPGTLPIQDARKYALVFNLKRASQLGITIPSDILMAADEVITE
ncbi:MAG: hypothetical protein GY737_31175 [Desulfobacteraceae bacterium]|nr:hypothetical protein [Desulfobacteraceae bacterium]